MSRARAALGGAICLLAALAARPAAGQDRPPEARQTLVDLANVLGESHALRQACQGRQDQFWFSRMQQLLDVEAPDQGFRNRLVLSFNTGYSAGKAEFPACNPANHAEAAKIARRGKALSDSLALP